MKKQNFLNFVRSDMKPLRHLIIKTMLICCIILMASIDSQANNLSISNVYLTGQNTTDDYTLVQFDISWDNSWRMTTGPSNWDAAWIFIKYRIGSGEWAHAWLSNANHTVPDGTTLDVGLLDPASAYHATTNPGLGVFIYRSANGTGTFTNTGVQLAWNYGNNGLADDDVVDVQVFAIEMAYIPQGSFYVGDGTSNDITGQLTDYNSTNAYQITSENSITLGGSSSGNMRNNNAAGMNTADDFNNTTTQSLPTNFPKGYDAFYCMKYEISQGQYTDFLNTLNRTQQNARTSTDLASGITSVTNRYVMSNTTSVSRRICIRCNETVHATDPINFYCDYLGYGSGGYSSDGRWIACGSLSWADLAAYLDWAGLRPMTELEFEKACRGTLSAVADEFAWGETTVQNISYGTINGGTDLENISGNYGLTVGNSHYENTNAGSGEWMGLWRVGIFAGNGQANNVRRRSGAGYYGNMEMSGNAWERPVNIGTSEGRAFTGKHGNGLLNASGEANVTNWPGSDAVGTGHRGSSYVSTSQTLRISDRNYTNLDYTARPGNRGGRGVRSAQ